VNSVIIGLPEVGAPRRGVMKEIPNIGDEK